MPLSKKTKRELIEWTVLISIPLFLYFTGKHTEVLGQIQRVLLMPGIIQPDISLAEDEQLAASYEFTLVDLEGRPTPFGDLKGKTIFMNFWATWCAPCIAEMPDIQGLYDNLKSEDIVFVLISVDKDRTKAQKFIERKAFTFPVYQVATPLPSVYSSGSIPTTFVISPEGKIVAKQVGMAKYDTRRFREFLQVLQTNGVNQLNEGAL